MRFFGTVMLLSLVAVSFFTKGLKRASENVLPRGTFSNIVNKFMSYSQVNSIGKRTVGILNKSVEGPITKRNNSSGSEKIDSTVSGKTRNGNNGQVDSHDKGPVENSELEHVKKSNSDPLLNSNKHQDQSKTIRVIFEKTFENPHHSIRSLKLSLESEQFQVLKGTINFVPSVQEKIIDKKIFLRHNLNVWAPESDILLSPDLDGIAYNLEFVCLQELKLPDKFEFAVYTLGKGPVEEWLNDGLGDNVSVPLTQQ